MFGLLGGLLGGGIRGGIARSALSGRPVLSKALGGLMDKRSPPASGGRSVQSVQPPQDSSTDIQEEAKPVEQAPPQQPMQAAATAQPATQPLAKSSPSTFETAQPQPTKTPLSGLMEDAPPADARPMPQASSDLKPQSVVNESQANTTVARPETEVFGETPQQTPTEMGNQVSLDKPPKLPRLQVEWKDYLPLESPDMPAPSLGIDLPYRSPASSGLGTTGFGFRYMKS
jgi:hypothetical protein